MDLRILGIILTVTGIVAIAVTQIRGTNLGIQRRTGLIAGVVLLVIGMALLIYEIAVPH